jgi:hypothetical protein
MPLPSRAALGARHLRGQLADRSDPGENDGDGGHEEDDE